MAPLDVVKADSTVATDKQALISSQIALNYQQQIIKQAIARNLNDPALSTAPVIPTDRVSLEQIPEESQPVEDAGAGGIPAAARAGTGGADAAQRRDHAEGRAERSAADSSMSTAILADQGVGGANQPELQRQFLRTQPVPHGPDPTAVTALRCRMPFNNSAPDKGVGFT